MTTNQIERADFINTVTIPVDEYFDLKQKAEMNGTLMMQLGELYGRLNVIERDICDLKYNINCK